jgi:hypothetical protein
MAPISSWMRLVSRSIWMPSASMWSSGILASSAWWPSKRPVSAATSALAAHPPPGQLGEHLGVTLPGDERLQHGPPGDPMMSVATVPSLIRASSSSFSSRCTCRARSPVRSDRSRV